MNKKVVGEVGSGNAITTSTAKPQPKLIRLNGCNVSISPVAVK